MERLRTAARPATTADSSVKPDTSTQSASASILKGSNLAFLAEISDDCARLSSADDIMQTAGRKIATFLQLSSCAFNVIDLVRGETRVPYGWFREDVPNLIGGLYRHTDFVTNEFHRAALAGEIVVVEDTRADARIASPDTYEAIKMRSFVTVPFFRDGVWKFLLAVTDSKPRVWASEEIELITELSNRIFPRLERATAEAALRQSELRYRTLFEKMDEGYCVIEVLFDSTGVPNDYRFIEVNPAFEQQTGLRNAVGKRMRELVPNHDTHWFEIYGRVALTGESVRFLNEARAMKRWFDVHASRFGEPEERKVALLFTDITERKQAEEDLRESEERFRAFVTTSSDVVYRMSADWGEMFHLAGKDFIADTSDPSRTWLQKYIHPDDQARVLAAIREAIRSKGTFALEHRVIRLDGTLGWTYSRAIPRLDANGEIVEWFGAAKDITESKRAEAAQRESELRYRTLFETMDEGFCVIEFLDGPHGPLSDYIHLEANPAYERHTGIPNVVGQRVREMVPNEAAAWVEFYRKVLTTGEPIHFERELVATGRHLELSSFRIEPESRRQVAVLFQDVTARKRAEQELRKSTERFDIVRDGAQVGFWFCDLPFDELIWDNRVKEHFWLAPSDRVTIDTFYERLHPDDRERTRAAIAQSITDKTRYDIEYRTVSPLDGREKWIRAMGRTFYGDKGQPIRFDGVTLDTTERKQVEEAARQSAERLRFMAESMPQKIFTARPTGEMDYFNRQWMDFTGLTLEQLRDWGWLEFLHPEERDENIRRWKHSVASGDYFEIEHRFRRHDGVYRWHLTRAHAMSDANGEVAMWIGSSTDIEDQKRAEEKLERIVAERTARLRETIGELEAFSYSIAHDMRAPLRSLQGFSDVLLTDYADKIDAEGQSYLRRIARSAGRMDKLIQDVLSYSRIARGEWPFESVNVEQLLRGIAETYPALTAEKVDIVLQGEFPSVLGSEAMLMQVFSNLLGNAVKFVPAGTRPHIQIWAERRGERVRFFIRDNGIGIASEEHVKIFAIFHQVGKNLEGTGIGLAIVKKAVERMNGTVGVDSQLGHGTTFWVEVQRA